MTGSSNSDLSALFSAITLQSSEAEVEEKVIQPLLHLLGYSNQDWQDQIVIDKVRLDFCVHPKEAAVYHPPYLVIEAKAPKKKLTLANWQINGYMRKSGAILGLLTNGYQFRILYNYNGEIETIVEYSQEQLAENFRAFSSLLSKKTCLTISDALFKKQYQFHTKLVGIIAKAFNNEAMLGLFKKKQNQLIVSQGTSENPSDFLDNEEDSRRKSMILTIFNNKGGVGKTTFSINLGAALNKLGYKVLLIDIDAQANLTTGLGINPLDDIEKLDKKDISHLLLDPRTKLEETIYKKQWGNLELDIVPSHIRLSRMENDLMRTVDIDRVLSKKLKNHDYDFILIDPPPSFGKINGIALMASSGILIPTQLSPYPIRAIEYVIKQAREVESFKDEPLPILGVAVSMYDQKSSSFNKSMKEKIDEILQITDESNNISVFPEDTWIPRLNFVSNLADKSYPIYHAEFDDELSYQDKNAASKASEKYTEVAKFLLTKIGY